VDPDLRELHYGEWELEKGTVVARRYREQHRLMRAEDPAWHPPGGENIHQVRTRTYAALQRILKQHRNQTTLIVAHGTAINCLLSEVLCIPPTHNFRFGVSNCSLSEVQERDRLYVRYLNDTSHLAGVESPPES
jgi:broad specificity phosphatase PhoE